MIFTPSKLDDICGFKWNENYLGPGDLRTMYPSIANKQFVILPISMPLPVGHTIPIGQIFSPNIGAAGLHDALASMAGGSVCTSAASGYWVPRLPFPQIQGVAAAPVVTSVPAFTAPPVSAVAPASAPYLAFQQIQLVNSLGNPVQSKHETPYGKREPHSLRIDAQQQWGPENLFFLFATVSLRGRVGCS
jgi:hypothetical protein